MLLHNSNDCGSKSKDQPANHKAWHCACNGSSATSNPNARACQRTTHSAYRS